MSTNVLADVSQREASELPEVVYTPESPIRHPLRLVAAMWRDLVASRQLAWRLFVRDISSMYRQSLFGYLWAFVPPVLAALPWMFLNSQKIVNVGSTPIAYPVYVMTGMMLWQSFLDALNSPLKQTQAARSMLSKINFPREALLLAGIAESFWNLMIRMVLLVPVLWLYGSWGFSAGNLRDVPQLAQHFKSGDTKLSAYIWSHLSPESREAIDSSERSPVPGPQLGNTLIHDLTALLESGPLYDAERFADIPLSETTRASIQAAAGSKTDLARLNQRLLEEAYPGAVVPYNPASTLLWAPLGIMGLMIFGFALGLFITPLGLLYTDVSRGISLIASFGMLLTPIVYPPRTTGLAGWLSTWNPVSPVLVTARDWLTGQHAAYVTQFMWVTAGSVVLCLFAWFLYRLTMPILVERMGG